MDYSSIDILLVEDNEDDAELAMRELKKNKLTSNLFHVRDGEEAFDFIYGTGKYAGITEHSKFTKGDIARYSNAEGERNRSA